MSCEQESCYFCRLKFSRRLFKKITKESNRDFEISRDSIIKIDSAIGITIKLEDVPLEELQPLENSIIKTFKLLSGIIKTEDFAN